MMPRLPNPSPGCRLPLASAQHDETVRRAAEKDLLGEVAVRPAHSDRIDALGGAQAEVGARVVAAQVALTGVDGAHPGAATGLDRDHGAVSVALVSGIDGPDEQ